jgi:hypothetical protein
MLQLAGDLGLGHEPRGRSRVGRILVVQQLDGYIAIQPQVAGAIDDAHAAAADLVEQLIARQGEKRFLCRCLGRVRRPCFGLILGKLGLATRVGGHMPSSLFA